LVQLINFAARLNKRYAGIGLRHCEYHSGDDSAICHEQRNQRGYECHIHRRKSRLQAVEPGLDAIEPGIDAIELGVQVAKPSIHAIESAVHAIESAIEVGDVLLGCQAIHTGMDSFNIPLVVVNLLSYRFQPRFDYCQAFL